QGLGFGEGATIDQMSYVYGDVQVGRDVWIGPFTLLDGTGGLSIGDFCTISAGVHIYSHDTIARTVTGGQNPIQRSPVTIGSRTYIGSQSVIERGVPIGGGSVIDACSVFNREVPAAYVAVGPP